MPRSRGGSGRDRRPAGCGLRRRRRSRLLRRRPSGPGSPNPRKARKPPRPRGATRISGVWTSDAALGIARERPEKFADRAFLTDEEFAEAQKADDRAATPA